MISNNSLAQGAYYALDNDDDTTFMQGVKEGFSGKNTKKCPTCGNEIPSNSKFCNNCGAKLNKVCPSCGSENESDANYCFKCGQKLDN